MAVRWTVFIKTNVTKKNNVRYIHSNQVIVSKEYNKNMMGYEMVEFDQENFERKINQKETENYQIHTTAKKYRSLSYHQH